MISVGVYGDFVEQEAIPNIFPLMAEHATIGIGGRIERKGRQSGMRDIGKFMEKAGFEVLAEKVRNTHYVCDDKFPVEYVYVVARR